MVLGFLRRNKAKKRTASDKDETEKDVTSMTQQERQDYDDLQHISRKREIKITIRKGTQAGVAAGLSVMAGVIVAGPVGAVVGGCMGTFMAARISRNVVSMNDLLEETPVDKRREVIQAFNESFKEEFLDTVQRSPELKLIMGGGSIFGALKYMVDKDFLKEGQLDKLDKLLKNVM